MAYTLSFKEDGIVLCVAAAGSIGGFDEFSEKAKAVVGKVIESDRKRILLDDRKLDVRLDAHDITLLAEQLEKARLQTMGLRLACVCDPNHVDTYQTIETIYQNRSISFRLFDEIQAALDWLNS